MAAMLMWMMMNAAQERADKAVAAIKAQEEKNRIKPNDMKETIDNLNKESDELYEKCKKLTLAMDSLREVRPDETKVIEDLRTEYNGYVERRNQISTAVLALQAVCKHEEWEAAGHDSHYNYSRCKVCGVERKV